VLYSFSAQRKTIRGALDSSALESERKVPEKIIKKASKK
jgi:hypothetical protein